MFLILSTIFSIAFSFQCCLIHDNLKSYSVEGNGLCICLIDIPKLYTGVYCTPPPWPVVNSSNWYLAFAIDESGLVRHKNYTTSLKFAENMVPSDIQTNANFSLIAFTSGTDRTYKFADSQNEQIVVAMTYLRTVLESFVNQIKSITPQYSFLITAGYPNGGADVCTLILCVETWILCVGPRFDSNAVRCLDDIDTMIVNITITTGNGWMTYEAANEFPCKWPIWNAFASVNDSLQNETSEFQCLIWTVFMLLASTIIVWRYRSNNGKCEPINDSICSAVHESDFPEYLSNPIHILSSNEIAYAIPEKQVIIYTRYNEKLKKWEITASKEYYYNGDTEFNMEKFNTRQEHFFVRSLRKLGFGWTNACIQFENKTTGYIYIVDSLYGKMDRFSTLNDSQNNYDEKFENAVTCIWDYDTYAHDKTKNILYPMQNGKLYAYNVNISKSVTFLKDMSNMLSRDPAKIIISSNGRYLIMIFSDDESVYLDLPKMQLHTINYKWPLFTHALMIGEYIHLCHEDLLPIHVTDIIPSYYTDTTMDLSLDHYSKYLSKDILMEIMKFTGEYVHVFQRAYNC